MNKTVSQGPSVSVTVIYYCIRDSLQTYYLLRSRLTIRTVWGSGICEEFDCKVLLGICPVVVVTMLSGTVIWDDLLPDHSYSRWWDVSALHCVCHYRAAHGMASPGMSDQMGRQRDREKKMECTLPPTLGSGVHPSAVSCWSHRQSGRVRKRASEMCGSWWAAITAGSPGVSSVPLLTELEEALLFFWYGISNSCFPSCWQRSLTPFPCVTTLLSGHVSHDCHLWVAQSSSENHPYHTVSGFCLLHFFCLTSLSPLCQGLKLSLWLKVHLNFVFSTRIISFLQ